MSRRYAEVDAADVPRRTRLAAENAVRFAAVDLEITPPAIRWFTDCPATPGEAWASLENRMTPPPPAGSFEHPKPIYGKAGADDAVWIRVGLGPRLTASTALHETLHVFQRRLVGPAHGPLEFAGREAQARGYETDLAGIAESIANLHREGAPNG